MPMPKASMNKDYCLKFWHNNIGLSRKLSDIFSIPEAFGKQESTDSDFRPRFGTPNLSHDLTSYLFGKYVSQYS